jgi:type I restriction enzyme S subunit
MSEWRASTWGNEISLEYGKGIRGYAEASGPYRVFGANGPVGWTDEPLATGPGVILGRKGAYRGVQFSREPFFVIDTAYYVVPKSELDMRWLYFAIIHHRLGEIDDGSPIPSTTRAAVYVRNLRVPAIAEQNAVASVLGALDDKIELNQRMNETLEAMARAIYEEAGRASGWQPRPLNEYAAIFDGPHATPTLTPEGPVFLGISNLKSGMLNLSDTNHLSEADFQTWTRRVTPTPGDVVFSYETRLGQAALIPRGLRCCLGRRMGLLRPHRDRIAPVVLLRAYLSADFQEVIRKHTIHGATVERIPLKDMGNFPIRLPDRSQNPGLADQLAALRDLVEANQSESATLAATRDLLLPRLMSGELRVKDAERAIEAAA